MGDWLPVLQFLLILVLFIARSISADTPKVNLENSNCVDVTFFDCKKKYCGVSRIWQSRLDDNNKVLLILVWIGSVLSAVIPLLCSCYLTRKGISTKGLQISWDGLDVFIDICLFQDLEYGFILGPGIYPNGEVNKCILAFAILGALKILLWLPFFSLIKAENEIEDVPDAQLIKRLMFALTFLLEDGPELFLEYFYVEKFFTTKHAWLYITKDCILVVIGIMIFFRQCSSWKESENSRSLTISNLPICFLMIARVAAVMYQYLSKQLSQSCFAVVDGALVQTPFAKGCMTWFDYLIAILLWFNISLTFIVLCFFTRKAFRQWRNCRNNETDISMHSCTNDGTE